MRAADPYDPVLARAGAIIDRSRSTALARRSLELLRRAAAGSHAAGAVARWTRTRRNEPARERAMTTIAVAVGAAAVHATLAWQLPFAAAPTTLVTAATLIAAIVALRGA